MLSRRGTSRSSRPSTISNSEPRNSVYGLWWSDKRPVSTEPATPAVYIRKTPATT